LQSQTSPIVREKGRRDVQWRIAQERVPTIRILQLLISLN
jgi:hypothetical protein